jgi:hypothetical protein
MQGTTFRTPFPTGAGHRRGNRGALLTACFPASVKLTDALGVGPTDGRTVVPVSVWLPLVVLFSVPAGLLLARLGGEGRLIQLAVTAVAMGLVVSVATAITLWRNKRRR